MSKLDVAKEQIAYLKLWLGILVATTVSLTGWLLSNFPSVGAALGLASVMALLAFGALGLVLHKKIERKINELEDL